MFRQGATWSELLQKRDCDGFGKGGREKQDTEKTSLILTGTDRKGTTARCRGGLGQGGKTRRGHSGGGG